MADFLIFSLSKLFSSINIKSCIWMLANSALACSIMTSCDDSYSGWGSFDLQPDDDKIDIMSILLADFVDNLNKE